MFMLKMVDFVCLPTNMTVDRKQWAMPLSQ